MPELIVDAALRWGIPPERFLCIAWHESRFDPFAWNPSGAAGVYQFMPKTWGNVWWRVSDHANVYDPVVNIEGAAWLYHHVGPRQWEVVTKGLC